MPRMVYRIIISRKLHSSTESYIELYFPVFRKWRKSEMRREHLMQTPVICIQRVALQPPRLMTQFSHFGKPQIQLPIHILVCAFEDNKVRGWKIKVKIFALRKNC